MNKTVFLAQNSAGFAPTMETAIDEKSWVKALKNLLFGNHEPRSSSKSLLGVDAFVQSERKDK